VTRHDIVPEAWLHPLAVSDPQSDPGLEVLEVELGSDLAPLTVLDRMEGMAGRVLLERASGGRGLSLVTADPLAVLQSSQGRTTVTERYSGGTRSFSDPFEALSWLLERFRMPVSGGMGAFAGGIIGYLGYECGDYLERLPSPAPDDIGVPDAWFGIYDGAIVWDHQTGAVSAVASTLPGQGAEAARRRLASLTSMAGSPPDPLDEMPAEGSGAGREMEGREGGGRAGPHDDLARRVPAPDPGFPQTSLSRDAFEAAVDQLRDLIRAGDLFQANLTRRISFPTGLSGPEMYRRLVAESPAPHGACLDCGEVQIASISPELFLSVRGSAVCTQPIKGTRPRGMDPEEDRRLERELAESGKDHAENVMIVDLLRNDLSRVCLPGSIAVPRLAELESHPTVHHLVSTVVGKLAPGMGVIDLLRASFPGGSISGAPKIRAMEVLRGLEPVRRSVYTGALGIIGFQGDMELSVAIRTAVIRDGWAHYGTGGGITLQSDPAAEWEETIDKAAAFLRALDSDP